MTGSRSSVAIGVAVLAFAATASASGQAVIARHYQPSPMAAPALRSAGGHGAVARATLPSFAAAARLSKHMKVPRAYAPAPGMTSEGIAAKARAERGHGAPGSQGVNVARGGAREAPDAPSFPGINQLQSGFIPPDVQMAAGPFQIVEAVNGRITIFNKNGSTASSSFPSAFFSGLGTVATDGPFDPQVVFDEYLQRFILLYSTRNDAAGRSTMLMAVSNSKDATGSWSLFGFNARVDGSTPTTNWCDYPHLGYSRDTIEVTCNMFVAATPTNFAYVKVRTFSASQLSGGPGCCFFWDFVDLRDGPFGLNHVFTVQPAAMHNAVPSDGAFLAASQGSGGNGNNIHVYRITNQLECCNGDAVGPTLNVAERQVNNYSAPPQATQPGGVQAIDTGDSRLLYAVFDFPTMFVGHNTGFGSNSAVAFTEWDISGYPNMPLLNDWVLGSAGTDRYYPAADSRIDHEKSMVFSASGSTTNAESRFVDIPKSSTCTSCTNGEFVQRSGAGTYLQLDNRGRNRWGDYLDASRDPDAIGIWIGGEFVAAQDTWGTEISLSREPIDTSAPFTTATLSPPANANGWNNTNVNVQLNAIDSGSSGVRRITFSALGANPIPPTTVDGNSATVSITADGSTNVIYSATDNWGNVEPQKFVTVRKDSGPPSTPLLSAPARFLTSTGIPVAWSASDDVSGVASFDAQVSSAPAATGVFGPFTNWLIGTGATSATFPGSPGHTYCFRVLARDQAGNASLFSQNRCGVVPVDDAKLTIASGAWTRDTSATGFYRKTSTNTTAQSAALKSAPIVAKQLAVVARTCPTCGSVRVLWNGVVVKKISLQASPGATKRVFKIPAFATQQSGVARIEVTSTGKPVNIDGLEVSPL
jgi:hypothetical protein